MMNSDLIKRLVKYGFSLISFRLIIYIYKSKIPLIANDIETLDAINDNKLSVSRFGDGELNLIEGRGNSFTDYNSTLATRLKEVLTSDNDKHIICVPPQLRGVSGYRLSQKLFWSNYLTHRLKDWLRYLNPKKKYYSAFISRFYLSYLNPKYTQEIVSRWKRIWEKKDILLIEGEYTRLGVGNDLFDNARSIKRLICPSENAFERYNNILAKATEYKENLILIALGQSASVLAFDLSNYGCWAIDVGHIDIEYEWFLQQTREKVPIKNKYTNEVRVGTQGITECNDPKYQGQIICKII